MPVTLEAKICGLSTPEAVRAALDGGASHVGFVFFAKSPRNLTPDAAQRLAEPARGRARVVAVTVDPTDADLDVITSLLKPDLIQLHGREDPGRVRAVAARTGAGVIKALSVSEVRDLDTASAFDGVADHLMFDAKPPKDAALPGGVGARFDWTLLEGRRFSRPWFLAGGLDPWNVAEAVGRSGAPMVDVSSGVERGPGLKDPALISAFLEAVKRAS
jgi:phosphoribosylanthranilate isomerase